MLQIRFLDGFPDPTIEMTTEEGKLDVEGHWDAWPYKKGSGEEDSSEDDESAPPQNKRARRS